MPAHWTLARTLYSVVGSGVPRVLPGQTEAGLGVRIVGRWNDTGRFPSFRRVQIRILPTSLCVCASLLFFLLST